MIENSRKSSNMRESRKDYFVLFDDGNAIGVVSAGEQSAQVCLSNIAMEKDAVCLSDTVWKYKDLSGEHLLWMKRVKRYNIR